MGALVASLISLAPVLIGPIIKSVEALFGPKTGDVKMQAVIEALMPVLQKLAASGKLTGVPDESTLKTVIETIFQKDKLEIENPAKVEAVCADFFQNLPAGTTITIVIGPETPNGLA